MPIRFSSSRPPATMSPYMATMLIGASPQLHFELVASVKLLTEFTTPAAAGAIAAICAADGFEGSALTAVEKASTDDVMALVSVGKSPLAEFTSEVASVWIFVS